MWNVIFLPVLIQGVYQSIPQFLFLWINDLYIFFPVSFIICIISTFLVRDLKLWLFGSSSSVLEKKQAIYNTMKSPWHNYGCNLTSTDDLLETTIDRSSAKFSAFYTLLGAKTNNSKHQFWKYVHIRVFLKKVHQNLVSCSLEKATSNRLNSYITLHAMVICRYDLRSVPCVFYKRS